MSLDPVVIDFAARGMPTVSAAFDSIESRIKKMETSATQTASRESKARVKTAQDEEKAKTRSAAATAKEKDRIERQATRDAESEAKRREGIVRKSSEMAGRIAVQQAKADERAAQEGTRAIEREEERRMRIRIRSSEMAGRYAAQEAAKEMAALQRQTQRESNLSSSRWRHGGRRIGGVVSGSVGSLVSGVGSIAGATMGIGGGMLLADAARGEMSAHKSAQLIVNAVTSGGTTDPGVNVDAILGKASQVGRANGLSKDAVAEAGLAYARSAQGGDFQGVLGNMDFFAKVSNVTGADMNELASSAGMLQSQNPKLGGKNNGAMQQMLLDVLQQTHLGSLSMPEVAKMAGVIGSGRGAFGGDQSMNQRKLLGLAQLVAPETDPAEAGTMIKDFATEGQKHRKSTASKKGLEALGVKYNAQGGMESIEQTIDAVLTGTKGDYGKILDAFGSDRGAKLFAHLNPIFNDAGGGAAGLAAVHKTLDPFLAGGGMSSADLDKRNAETLDDPANKLHRALNQITDEIGQSLEPRLKAFADDTLPKLIPKIEAVIDAVGSFAAFFAENPLAGVGAIVLAAITKDLAAAGIGAGVRAAIAAMMQGVGASGGLGGAVSTAGGVSGNLGKAGLVGAAAVTGAAIGYVISDAAVDAERDQMNASVGKGIKTANVALDLFGKSRTGKVTAADIAAAQAEAKTAGEDLAQKKAQTENQKSLPSWLPGSADRIQRATAEQKSAETSFALLNKAILAASTALQKMSTTASNVPDPRRSQPISQRPVQ